MLVVVAAVVTNGESQKPRRLTQAPLQLKCSRSPLHRAAASPLQATPKLSRLSALKMFLETLAQRLL
jgi:hypothetical protein